MQYIEKLRRRVIEKHPETMQKEWAEEFGVSKTAIHYAMRRMKLTRKKKLGGIKNLWTM